MTEQNQPVSSGEAAEIVRSATSEQADALPKKIEINRRFKLWVDLETTGLDPQVDIPLEVGFILTSQSGQFIEEARDILLCGSIVNIFSNASPFIKDMHTSSGLFVELAGEAVLSSATKSREIPFPPSVAIQALDENLALILSGLYERNGIEVGSLAMCGSSVQFDRSFIEHHLPETAKYFHYRNVDVSGTREMLYAAAALVSPKAVSDLEALFKPAGYVEEHRALPDLRNTISLYKKMQTLILKGVRGHIDSIEQGAREDAVRAASWS